MATSSTSSRRFSRTMALAIATGITLTGGVQIVNDTHVAQAETITIDDNTQTKQYGYFKDTVGNKYSPVVARFNGTDGYVVTLNSYQGAQHRPYITREALETAGLDFSQPFTIDNISVSGKVIYNRKSSTGNGSSIGASGEFVEKETYTMPDFAHLRIGQKDETDANTALEYLRIKQGNKTITLNVHNQRIEFFPADKTTIKPGEDATGKAPKIDAQTSALGVGENVMKPSYRLRNDVKGFYLNSDGSFVYNPPTDFAGGYVEAEIVATLDTGVNDYKIVNDERDGDLVETSAIYRFYVEPQPQADKFTTITNEGDGAYKVKNADGKTFTINTKDGVQNVTQKGNTLTFTMANGSTKDIPIGSNVTLTENNNGTATISDGTTTITVATANTYVKEIVNTKGKYTLKLNDGTTVKGVIDTSKNVKSIENGPNGSIVLVYNDDTKSKPIALTQTTVTQANEGTNNHTVTITSPNGEKVTIKAANTYLDKVEKNAKGDYVLTRNDKQTFTINLQDIRNDIAALKEKDSPSRAEHNAVKDNVDKLRKQLNEFTGQTNESLEDLANQIDALDDKVDANAKEFKDALTGISTDLQDLEFRVTRTENRLIKEVRDNHDGTFTLVTEKYGDIPGVIDASSGVTNIISNSDGTITLEFAGKKPRTIDLHQVEVSETGKGTPKHTITIKVPGEEPFRFNAFDTYVTDIETDGKGAYTLKLNNGETVTGVIDTSKTVKTIENRPDGSIVLVRTDGTKSDPIKLEQVKITESKKGTPEHTVTIKVPGGETVTLDAYDNFVTSVTKKSDGIYEIARNDGQKWTINIADLYKRVADLEAKDSPTRDEFNAVKKDIADYKKLVDKRFTKVEGDIDALRADLTAVEKRVTVLEARVDRIDNVLGDLAKCNSAKQIAAIPTALSVALYALSQMQLPGVADINTQIQQQIGIYNANAAKMWGQYGGVLQTAAATTMAAGLIGSLAYALSECQPYNRTDEMKNTPAGEMTAKADARKAERQARAEARAEARSAKQAA